MKTVGVTVFNVFETRLYCYVSYALITAGVKCFTDLHCLTVIDIKFRSLWQSNRDHNKHFLI